jgi:hypothetical protein
MGKTHKFSKPSPPTVWSTGNSIKSHEVKLQVEQNGCDAANSLSDSDEISMIMIKIVGNGLFVCTNVLVFKIQMNLILHLWFERKESSCWFIAGRSAQEKMTSS